MSNSQKRSGEQPAWLDPNLHVWLTKGGELAIINLRNQTEILKTDPATQSTTAVSDGAVPAPRSAARSGKATGTPTPASNAAVTTSKNRGEAGGGGGLVGPAAKSAAPSSSNAAAPLTQAGGKAAGSTTATGVAASAAKEVPLAARLGALLPNIRVKTVSTADATPATVHEKKKSPEPTPSATFQSTSALCSSPPAAKAWQERTAPLMSAAADSVPSSSGTGGASHKEEANKAAFEFVAGTNIPGHGVVGTKEAEEPTSLALFHDPLWGSGANTWATSASKKTANSPAPSPAAAGTAATQSLMNVLGMGRLSSSGALPMQAQTPPQTPPLSFGSASSAPLQQGFATHHLMSPLQQQQQVAMLSGGFAGMNHAGYFTHSAAGLTTIPPAQGASYIAGAQAVQTGLASATLAGYPLVGIPSAYVAQQQGSLFASPEMAPYGHAPYYFMSTATSLPASQGQPSLMPLAGSAVSSRSNAAISPAPSTGPAGTNVEATPFTPGQR